MKYCSACGTQLEDSAAFCSNCGAKQGAAAAEQPARQETLLDALTGSVNQMTGGKKEAVRPPLGKLFGQVFKKHSQEEAETIFACGTPATTPRLTSAEAAWPTPWLWCRSYCAWRLGWCCLC